MIRAAREACESGRLSSVASRAQLLFTLLLGHEEACSTAEGLTCRCACHTSRDARDKLLRHDGDESLGVVVQRLPDGQVRLLNGAHGEGELVIAARVAAHHAGLDAGISQT